MEHDPLEYQKLQIRPFPARSLRETAEGRYWKRFRSPVLAQQFGGVVHLDFCATHPFDLAVTAATRVVIYDTQAQAVKKTISRFKDKAFSGVFRDDGRLLAAGGADGVVQVFDAGSRSVLRSFTAHQRATHVARFAPDRAHMLSGSDDVTVRWWDVTTGAQLLRLDGHADYVRAGAHSPSSLDTWATGGYDHACKLWDVRSGRAVMDLGHGAPIEDLAWFGSGARLVLAPPPLRAAAARCALLLRAGGGRGAAAACVCWR